MDRSGIDTAEKGMNITHMARQASGLRQHCQIDQGDDFGRRIAVAGSPHIFYTLPHRYQEPVKCVNLVALQRMNMHFLQKELSDKATNIMSKGSMDETTAGEVRKLLHEYCKFHILGRQVVLGSCLFEELGCLSCI